MEDWIQLTEEDIARAHRLTRERPPMPDVLIITPDDLGVEDAGRSRLQAVDAALQITHADLHPTAPQETTTPALQALEARLFEHLCRAREAHLPSWLGTSRLSWHPPLAAVARGHSMDMLRRQYVAHITPEGLTAAQRLDRQGIRYMACGENIGVVYGPASRGESGVDEVHQAFINQPRSMSNHRGNLLNPIWTHAGVGIAYGEEGALVVTQIFISSPAARLRGR
jgi:uncharacterized protein YkwD